MKRVDNDMENVVQINSGQECGPLTCVLHGDFWLNNMLFKSADACKQFRMVDFQLSRIGHPLEDILYFLYTSTLPEFREMHMENLLNHYYNMLTCSLERLGINIMEEGYTMDKFMQDYRKKSVPCMVIALWVIGLTIDSSVVTSLEDDEKQSLETNAQTRPNDETGDKTLEINKEDKLLLSAEKLLGNRNVTGRILGLVLQVKKLQEN